MDAQVYKYLLKNLKKYICINRKEMCYYPTDNSWNKTVRRSDPCGAG